MNWFISLVLTVGLLSLPGPTMPAPAKKSCCGAAHSAPTCPDCGGEKSDCCQPVPTIGPLIVKLTEGFNLLPPVVPKRFSTRPETYPARAETPLLPPPKVA